MFTEQEIVDLKLRQGDASRGEVLRLLARLEAAEATLNSCKRYQYDDGLVIVESPDVKLYEAWRKARGKE